MKFTTFTLLAVSGLFGLAAAHPAAPATENNISHDAEAMILCCKAWKWEAGKKICLIRGPCAKGEEPIVSKRDEDNTVNGGGQITPQWCCFVWDCPGGGRPCKCRSGGPC